MLSRRGCLHERGHLSGATVGDDDQVRLPTGAAFCVLVNTDVSALSRNIGPMAAAATAMTATTKSIAAAPRRAPIPARRIRARIIRSVPFFAMPHAC